ncbi:MAG TPA: type 4a pilus biogenesis protein PilO [Polyangiaceae bacterium]|nr:type 4a pilus biogenesis protein PilO [Polyangiaceae bacterium]
MAQAPQSSLAKLSTPAKVGVGVLLAFLVGLLYWVVFYSDVSAKINTAQNAQSRLRSELATQQQNQTSYLQDKDELATHQQRQATLNKALPEQTEAPAFLSALQQVANVSGVDLKAWQPMDEQAQAFYAKFPMRLELNGRFHQIAKFAYEAGRVERIINIENIEMSDPKLDGDEVKVKAKCLATTFHSVKAKPPAPPASAGQPPQAPPAPPGGKK